MKKLYINQGAVIIDDGAEKKIINPALINFTESAGEWATIYVTTTGSSDVELSMRWEEQF